MKACCDDCMSGGSCGTKPVDSYQPAPIQSFIAAEPASEWFEPMPQNVANGGRPILLQDAGVAHFCKDPIGYLPQGFRIL